MSGCSSGVLLSLLLFSSLFHSSLPRRGGGGGFGRGSSGARTGSGGGLFGGRSAGRAQAPRQPSHGRGTNYGGGTGFGAGAAGGAAAGYGANAGMRKQQGGSNWGTGGSGHGSYSKPKYSKSGIGSFVRSNSFKNAIVGAAAGYLTYQAGKAIIRAATGPMMWNSRPYYWGSSYYQPRHGQTNMCRMPIEPNDQQFGNVYFQDQSRPREIVWGCGHYEYCCGYECCRGGNVGGYGRGLGLGTVLITIFIVVCLLGMCVKLYRRKQMAGQAFTYIPGKNGPEQPRGQCQY